MAVRKKKPTKSTKPRLTPDAIMQLGLGFWGVSTNFGGSYNSGVYFIGRAGMRYFVGPRLALYGDVGAGAATLNTGVTFGFGGGK